MSILSPDASVNGLQNLTYIIWSTSGGVDLGSIQENFESGLAASSLPFLIEDPNGRADGLLTKLAGEASDPVTNSPRRTPVKALSALVDLR